MWTSSPARADAPNRAWGLAAFGGRENAGDTTATAWARSGSAFNAIAEHLDYGWRYTTRTSQVQLSFEDTALKQRGLELVLAA